MSTSYHFHKDCAHYDAGNLSEVKRGKKTLLVFKCPAAGGEQLYYKSDFHAIKWTCAAFEPRQMTIDDI